MTAPTTTDPASPTPPPAERPHPGAMTTEEIAAEREEIAAWRRDVYPLAVDGARSHELAGRPAAARLVALAGLDRQMDTRDGLLLHEQRRRDRLRLDADTTTERREHALTLRTTYIAAGGWHRGPGPGASWDDLPDAEAAAWRAVAMTAERLR